MAIRFKYQPSHALVGAFAAGQAAGRRRRQKYALDMWQQERRHQQRMEERFGGGYGTRLGGGSRRGIGFQEPGVTTDPLADDPNLTPSERRQRRAARTSRARYGRMGREIPGEWQPTFTSAEEIEAEAERRREEAEADAASQAALEKEQRGRKHDIGMAAAETAIEPLEEGFAQDEEDIKAGRYSPDDVKDLREVNAEMRAVLASERFYDEAQRQTILDDYNRKREEIRARAKDPPTPEEQARKHLLQYDPETGDFVPWGTGGPRTMLVPIDDQGMPDMRNAWTPEDPAAQAEKVEEKRQKLEDDLNKAQQSLGNLHTRDSEPTDEQQGPYLKDVEDKQKRLDAFNKQNPPGGVGQPVQAEPIVDPATGKVTLPPQQQAPPAAGGPSVADEARPPGSFPAAPPAPQPASTQPQVPMPRSGADIRDVSGGGIPGQEALVFAPSLRQEDMRNVHRLKVAARRGNRMARQILAQMGVDWRVH